MIFDTVFETINSILRTKIFTGMDLLSLAIVVGVIQGIMKIWESERGEIPIRYTILVLIIAIPLMIVAYIYGW